MNYLTIIMCLSIFLFSWQYEKNIYNPISIFSFLWFAIVSLSSMRLFGFYAASELTHLVIFIGVSCFLVGCYIVRFLSYKISKKNDNLLITRKKNANGLFFIKACAIIVLLIYIPYFVEALKMIAQGLNLDEIKVNATLGKFEVSQFVVVLHTYVARPLRYLIIPIALLNLLVDKKKDRILLAMTFFIIVFDFISSGSKVALFFIAVQMITVLFIFGRQNYVLSKHKKRIIKIFSIILAIIILYYLTMNGRNLGKSIYTYICGCIPFLSIKLDYFTNNPTLTYGMTSLQGFIRPIIELCKALGIMSVTPELFLTSESITGYVEYGSYIADGIIYNAFVTLFYYFYVDAQLIGVVIGSFIYGTFCEKAYKNMVKHTSRTTVILYLMIIQLLLTSMVRFQFSNIIYALAFFYYWLFIHKLKLYR